MTREEPLSALDAIFLPMETATQSLHVGSVLDLEGPPPHPEVFRDHVVAGLATVAVARRRVLRHWISAVPSGWMRTTSIPTSTFTTL